MARASLLLFVISALGAGAFAVFAQTGNREVAGNWTYYSPSPEKSVEIGNFYLRRNDDAAALDRFKEAVHNNSHYAPAYLGLGKVYEKTGKRRKALAAYQRYLRELPSDRDAARAKGVHRSIARLKQELAESHPQTGPSTRR